MKIDARIIGLFDKYSNSQDALLCAFFPVALGLRPATRLTTEEFNPHAETRLDKRIPQAAYQAARWLGLQLIKSPNLITVRSGYFLAKPDSPSVHGLQSFTTYGSTLGALGALQDIRRYLTSLPLLGKLLGYPDCCISAYRDDLSRQTSLEVRLAEQIQTANGQFDTRVLFAGGFGPCTPDCGPALAIGIGIHTRYAAIDERMSAAFLELTQRYASDVPRAAAAKIQTLRRIVRAAASSSLVR